MARGGRGRFFGPGGEKRKPPDSTLFCDKCRSDNIRSGGVEGVWKTWICNACGNEMLEHI